MLVLKAYLPTLRHKLSDMHYSFILDLEYNPFKPTQEDAEYWGDQQGKNSLHVLVYGESNGKD